MFPGDEPVGFETFPHCFAALDGGEVDRLALPIENSTTGSILPVVDRLLAGGFSIAGEHLVAVQHAVLAVPGTTLDQIERVHSHPEALTQAQGRIVAEGWHPAPEHDTAGAVRLVADLANPADAAMARPEAAAPHGLVVMIEGFVDQAHNTTRFVEVRKGQPEFAEDANKSSVVFETTHQPGALALALTDLGLRGANLTRIESRPTETAWAYRFHVNFLHEPGEAGFRKILEPTPGTLTNLHHLGTYPEAKPE